MTKEEWTDYFCLVRDQISQETKMPVLKGGGIIYDPTYDLSGVKDMTKSEVYEDPFWGAFEHAIKMLGFFKLLPDKECDYWFEFVDAQEYPSEEELDTFVNICKDGMKSTKETNPLISETNDCAFVGLTNSIDCAFVGLTNSVENIEGFWPYA